jgi:hypothetical protein
VAVINSQPLQYKPSSKLATPNNVGTFGTILRAALGGLASGASAYAGGQRDSLFVPMLAGAGAKAFEVHDYNRSLEAQRTAQQIENERNTAINNALGLGGELGSTPFNVEVTKAIVDNRGRTALADVNADNGAPKSMANPNLPASALSGYWDDRQKNANNMDGNRFLREVYGVAPKLAPTAGGQAAPVSTGTQVYHPESMQPEEDPISTLYTKYRGLSGSSGVPADRLLQVRRLMSVPGVFRNTDEGNLVANARGIQPNIDQNGGSFNTFVHDQLKRVGYAEPDILKYIDTLAHDGTALNNSPQPTREATFDTAMGRAPMQAGVSSESERPNPWLTQGGPDAKLVEEALRSIQGHAVTTTGQNITAKTASDQINSREKVAALNIQAMLDRLGLTLNNQQTIAKGHDAAANSRNAATIEAALSRQNDKQEYTTQTKQAEEERKAERRKGRANIPLSQLNPALIEMLVNPAAYAGGTLDFAGLPQAGSVMRRPTVFNRKFEL